MLGDLVGSVLGAIGFFQKKQIDLRLEAHKQVQHDMLASFMKTMSETDEGVRYRGKKVTYRFALCTKMYQELETNVCAVEGCCGRDKCLREIHDELSK